MARHWAKYTRFLTLILTTMKESAITVIPILQAVTENAKNEKKLQTETRGT